ncbi:hypothetical protein P691DRAFT_804848 [Macrolepiota fuliginosa MF-IS2]|uniref:Uncharacterized protein n=1 Tax=Macrolepiota fuliginosa MF-IS2 TaxID=1400762 RepID=A0A9P6C4Y3_9AGAR|nr:hypothetical protein P691DRAFT_804848 [Macrolepiota fuliginosa MF-IS2]
MLIPPQPVHAALVIAIRLSESHGIGKYIGDTSSHRDRIKNNDILAVQVGVNSLMNKDRCSDAPRHGDCDHI